MKIITSKTALVTAIESIRTRGKKLDNDIWIAAVSVIGHVGEHGDVTLARTLVDAMPKGSRVNALLAFMETFGKLTFNTDTKELDYDKTKTTELESAQETSWVEFKPEVPYQGLDLNKAILALIKKAVERSEDGVDGVDKVDAKQLASLQAIAVAA